MIRYLIIFLFFVVAGTVYSQDDIYLKKTKKPLDYDIKIIEVKNDTIYYKAFRKIEKVPLSEVDKYIIAGKAYAARPLPPIDKEKIEALEKAIDSVSYVSFPKGAYVSMTELSNKSPSVVMDFQKVKRKKIHIIMNGGNDYRFVSTSDSIKKRHIRKKIYAISDGDSLYLNCRKHKLQPWYAKVELSGYYSVFKASPPKTTYVIVVAGVSPIIGLGILLGVAIVGSQYMLKRNLYVVDSSHGRVRALNANFITDKLLSNNNEELLRIYNNEVDKNSEATLIKYIKIINHLNYK